MLLPNSSLASWGNSEGKLSTAITAIPLLLKSISFTIKDKKEDCKAIGFKPNTEKFADCVLKLVELDVKRQVNDSSMASQSQANQQIANELKKQNNLRQSQFLMNLSQQLLTPSSPASTMTSCRWSGQFLNCW